MASAENEITVESGKREEGSGKRGARSEDETTPPRTPELVVLSREDAESYEPRGREVCISISDPEAQPAQVSSRFAAVLRLYFNDITQMGEPTDILFGREHAAAIDEFIDDWPNIDRLVLHCNMGVSRSPGKLTQPDTQSVDLGAVGIGAGVLEHQTRQLLGDVEMAGKILALATL